MCYPMCDLRIASKSRSNASLTHLGGVILHCYVVFERLTKVPEIAQRQDGLKQLQAAHTALSVEVMQRLPNGGAREAFATEIDWLKNCVAHLSSKEDVLAEERTTAELRSRESRVMFHHTNSWFDI